MGFFFIYHHVHYVNSTGHYESPKGSFEIQNSNFKICKSISKLIKQNIGYELLFKDDKITYYNQRYLIVKYSASSFLLSKITHLRRACEHIIREGCGVLFMIC